ncbi:transcription factor MafK-like [Ixodes scapularis]|uniref:transcription factor MafK-like n=1 Tax=Ixodes scapularis TaxID=6945 RepID=UPI001A9DEFD6|nr:transcription factor MafK-like [Ixodes scapularis]
MCEVCKGLFNAYMEQCARRNRHVLFAFRNFVCSHRVAEPPKDSDVPEPSPDAKPSRRKRPAMQPEDDGTPESSDPVLLARLHLRVSETELADMSVRELNVELRERGLSCEQARLVKHLRRTLKNRGYAAVCRTRRVAQRSSLERAKGELRSAIEALREQNDELVAEVERVERDFLGLARWCVERGVPLPEDIRRDALAAGHGARHDAH